MISSAKLAAMANLMVFLNGVLTRAQHAVLTDQEIDAAWDNVNNQFNSAVERWEQRRREAAGQAFTPKGEVAKPDVDPA